MINTILNDKDAAHDALEESRYLQKLLNSLENVYPHYLSCTFNVQYVFFYFLGQENFMSLQPLVRGKCISENMAKKIANSGLCLHHLRLAFDRGGHDGIKILFSDKSNGKAREISNNLSTNSRRLAVKPGKILLNQIKFKSTYIGT